MNITISIAWLLPIVFAFLGLALSRVGDGPSAGMLLSALFWIAAIVSTICILVS